LGETTMQTGFVKWFDTVKGFGFIRPDDGDRDVFVHMSAVREAGLSILTEGQRLQFDVIADKRSGKNAASNLRLE
jgi:cold shock protein